MIVQHVGRAPGALWAGQAEGESVDWGRWTTAQAASGFVLGPCLDNFHNQYGVLAYDNYEVSLGDIIKSAAWVPPLFGVAAVLIGGMALVLDQVLDEDRRPPSLPTAVVATAAFAAHYYLSAVVARSDAAAIILWPLALGVWTLFDPSLATLATSIATAFAGPGLEIVLTGGGGAFPEPFGHLYHYIDPDFYGIDSWIPAVYFAGATPVAMLARCYAAGQSGDA